ncbi:hypothetical protein D9758_013502 [Tetrapyrgos nigripes]|uniref:BTB domain-containing protein n=1 Tax=Tetrapyrgos nigripes TaxID=182062 RepID=A0A8H5D2A7_9AGAR|nr:hypothetical protein D9758_013502 [Tetrapyrgos nigripes]
MSENAPASPDTAVDADSKASSKVSKLFSSGGDVIFRSSDGVLFHIQQKYLENMTEGFPLAEHTTPTQKDEIVSLPEKSSVLELLFQFTYPQMPPDLDDLEFPALMELAAAAEKYFVHHSRIQGSSILLSMKNIC